MVTPFSFGDVLCPDILAEKTDELDIDADSNTVASPDDTLKYTVTLKNIGNTTAAGVTFSDTPDINTSLVVGSVEVTGVIDYTITSGNSAGDTAVGVYLGEMEVGETAQIIFQVKIGYDGFTSVSNQGSVTGENFTEVVTDDPDTLEAGDPTVTPVTIGSPELSISKSGPETAHVGGVVEYTLEVTNIGDADALEVVVTDVLPAGMSYVGSSPEGVENGGVVIWEIGMVPAYGSVSITVEAEAEETVRG